MGLKIQLESFSDCWRSTSLHSVLNMTIYDNAIFDISYWRMKKYCHGMLSIEDNIFILSILIKRKQNKQFFHGAKLSWENQFKFYHLRCCEICLPSFLHQQKLQQPMAIVCISRTKLRYQGISLGLHQAPTIKKW